MKLRICAVAGAAACLALTGCGKGKEPTGQVVATVYGDEITAIDLRNEMGGFQAPDAATRKAAERQALEQIIQRKVLAHQAEEQKLDKSPEYVQQKQRLEEAFLVRFWEQKVAKAVPPPSKEEIDRFVGENPDLYAQHKVFVLDQVRTPMVRDASIAEALKPLKTLPEVVALFASRNMPYQQGVAQLDSLQAPPALVKQIVGLPAGEVFVVPQGNVLTVNQVREATVTPIPPEVPANHARQLLLAERTRLAVERELGSALARGRKEKDAVEYAKAYEPVAPKGAAAPAKK